MFLQDVAPFWVRREAETWSLMMDQECIGTVSASGVRVDDSIREMQRPRVKAVLNRMMDSWMSYEHQMSMAAEILDQETRRVRSLMARGPHTDPLPYAEVAESLSAWGAVFPACDVIKSGPELSVSVSDPDRILTDVLFVVSEQEGAAVFSGHRMSSEDARCVYEGVRTGLTARRERAIALCDQMSPASSEDLPVLLLVSAAYAGTPQGYDSELGKAKLSLSFSGEGTCVTTLNNVIISVTRIGITEGRVFLSGIWFPSQSGLEATYKVMASVFREAEDVDFPTPDAEDVHERLVMYLDASEQSSTFESWVRELGPDDEN